MYFASRLQAGRMLASQLAIKYRYENCAVVALNDGGVMVGAQIAIQLHSVLTMLLSATITLPQEIEPIAAVGQAGGFSYNQRFSPGEIDEMVSENRTYLEETKLTKIHDMNRLLGSGGLISRDLLRGRNIILVSDGLEKSMELETATDYLKPIAIEKLIIATPLASVTAVDRMHILADEIYCLSVISDFLDVAHYYDKQDVPDHKMVVETIENIILDWK